MALSGSLIKLNYNLSQIIEPNPKNYKILKSLNTTNPNISKYMMLSRKLFLSGSSQHISLIGRSGWRLQFGNTYLGKPVQLNYLGKMEGMPGGSGMPPLNTF